MEHADKVPLKTFWEAVEQRLSASSADELRAILRTMAHEVPPGSRGAFLARLGSVEEADVALSQAAQPGDLLADIDDLARELEDTMQHADTWEDRYDGEDYYDEEDSLGPYEEFLEPLAGLFDRAQAAFDHEDVGLARAAYQKLFDLLELEDDYGRRVSVSDLTGVDAGEAAARYLRAVYESESAKYRPQALYEQMHQVHTWLSRSRPMLDDLVQISPRSLPDREQFLADWIAFLRTQSAPSGSDADAWLREAVRLAQGTPGLEALARAEGQTRPRAYLDWLTALEQENRNREALAGGCPGGLAGAAGALSHPCCHCRSSVRRRPPLGRGICHALGAVGGLRRQANPPALARPVGSCCRRGRADSAHAARPPARAGLHCSFARPTG